MSDVLVVIPTYNELENISLMIEKVFSLSTEFHILIVDDNSPDGTGNMVKSLQQKFSDNTFVGNGAIISHLRNQTNASYCAFLSRRIIVFAITFNVIAFRR